MPGLREAEAAIYDMLLVDEPDMPDEERRKLAAEGARQAAMMRADELVSGHEVDIICECGEPQSRHVGGTGRCKDSDCSCESFAPERLRAGVQ
jgi:hypothetical protein